MTSESDVFIEAEPLERLGDWKHPIAHLSPDRSAVNLSTWRPFLTVADARLLRDWLNKTIPIGTQSRRAGKPSGFVAKCQCGIVTGALDYDRMDRNDAGKMLGEWLARGCTIEPRFGGTWAEHVGSCACSADSASRQQE